MIAEDYKLVWNYAPTHREWETGSATIWNTRCGRYSVCEVSSRESTRLHKYTAIHKTEEKGRTSESFVELDREIGGKAKGNYPRYFDTLEKRFKAVERYHTRKYGSCFTNREKFLVSLLTEPLQSETKESRPEETDEQKVLRTIGEKGKTVDQIRDETGIKTIRIVLMRMRSKGTIHKTGTLYTKGD